jgi:hypothetical protein
MMDRVLRATRSVTRSFWERPPLGSIGEPSSESRHPLAVAATADWRVTFLAAIFLAVLAAVAAYVRASALSPVILHDFGYGIDSQSGPITQDILFDADVSKRFELMTNRLGGRDHRSSHHPLLAMFIFPPVKALQAIGLGQIQAVKATMALVAGVWTILMFWLLVLWGCRIVDAMVFTVLGQVSASSMFWTSIPETYAFASATIIAGLILTLWPKWVSPLVRYTGAIAVTFAMTITNVMVGLIAGARRLPPKELWIVGTSAWFVVSMLWSLQKVIFPETAYFFPPSRWWVSSFLETPTLGRITQVVQVLLSHTMVMPEINVIPGAGLHPFGFPSAERVMSVQRSLAGTGGVWGALATLAWVGLAGLGAWAARVAPSGVGQLCLLILACQLALHVVFGPETFLFTMHVLPLLVVLAAGVAFTRLRFVGLALAVVVVVAGGVNNWGKFNKAVAVVNELDAYARTFPGARP